MKRANLIFCILSLLFCLSASGQGTGTSFTHNDGPTWYTDLRSLAENSSDTVYTTCVQFQQPFNSINFHTVGFQIGFSVLTGSTSDQYHIKIFGSKNGTDYTLISGDILFFLASDFQTSPVIYSYNYEVGTDTWPARTLSYKNFMIIFQSSSSGLTFNWKTYMLIR